MAEGKGMQYRYIESEKGTGAADEWLRKQKERKERSRKLREKYAPPKLSPDEIVSLAKRVGIKKDVPYASEMPMLPSEYLKKVKDEQEARRKIIQANEIKKHRARLDKIQGVKDARERQSELSRSPQEYEDHRIKSQEKEYKGFLDKAALNKLERARRGESPIIEDVEGSEKLLRESLPHTRASEREKMEALRRKHDRGIIGGGEAIDLSDPEYSGKRIYGGPHVGTDIEEKMGGMSTTRERKEELEGKSIPYTKEMEEEVGGKRLDLNDPDNRELLRDIDPEKAASLDQGDIDQEMTAGAKQDKLEDEINREFTGPIGTQEEAQQAIYDVSDEEQKEISRLVAEQKGMGSDEWVETKEATGKYVRYEGTGLVINMAALQKDIDRNRNMEMLKHIPAANRPAMLVEWGYIDPYDLSIAQKKSAKELKDLELVNLKIAETKLKMKNLEGSVPKKDEERYKAALKGFNQALKDKDYGLAEVHRNEINSIMPTGDTTNYKQLIDDGIKKQKIRTPQKVFQAAGLGKDGKEYYKTKADIIKRVNFLRETKGSKGDVFDLKFGEQMPDQPEGVTYGRFLTTQGIPPWKDVKGQKKVGNIPAYALKSEEEYYSWALPQIEDKLMLGIYGNVHTQVNDLNMKSLEKVKKDLADEVIRMPQPWEIGKPDPGMIDLNKKAANLKKDAPAVQQSSAEIEPKDISLEEQKKILKEANVSSNIQNHVMFKAGEKLGEGVQWVGRGFVKVGNFIYNLFSEEGQEELQKKLDSLGKE